METAQEALAAFDVMANLHQQRWGRAGAFANPAFRPFHEDLIARGVADGIVRISRTMAVEQTIGVLYNFVHDGLVLNYQSGFLYESDNRLKPGLVSLVLSVEDAIARGERGYDFMAGAAGHKNRLGNAERPLNWLVVGNDTLESRIEAGGGHAVRTFGRWRLRGGGSDGWVTSLELADRRKIRGRIVTNASARKRAGVPLGRREETFGPESRL
jgi:CelD/BcsL family acetyltransferase involved in cellulose biosynthesis